MSKKISPAKQALILKSKEAKELREEIQQLNAAPETLELTINDVLLIMYKKESGATTFKTFADWKKDGFKVKKGESAFRVWGTPKKAVVKDDSKNSESEEERKYKFWPMCCLFNEQQVEPIKSEPGTADIVKSNEGLENMEPVNNAFTVHNYQERQEARKTRLEERSQNAEIQAGTLYTQAKNMASAIPFGQPILVGHHSEKRDRRYRGRIEGTFRKSFQALDKAEHLQRRADSAGTGGIGSDDPEALMKLNNKLKHLIQAQETMKLANKQFRTGGWEAITALSSNQIKTLRDGFQDYERQPFPSYSLQNNNAEINRIKKRIKSLEAIHNSKPINFKSKDFKAYIDDGRVRFEFFSGKPSEEVRTILKRNAFKYSRHSQEWVRKVTKNALCATELVIDRLKSVESIY